MRVVAGEFKGCHLIAPAGEVARPTTDRVKESMFSLMGLGWEGMVAVDLFAGSGALGLEAVSRGANHAIFVDTHPRSIAAIRENIERCARSRSTGAESSKPVGEIWRMDWKSAWKKVVAMEETIGWVFVDPPYAANLWGNVLQSIAENQTAVAHGVVCEHPKAVQLPSRIGPLQVVKAKTYGDIAVTLYADHRTQAFTD